MKDTEFNVRRYIAEYSDETEDLIAEYDLKSFDLAKFQIEFYEPNKDDPMFACYPIKEGNITFLKDYLAKEPNWDFIKSSYFVEAHLI